MQKILYFLFKIKKKKKGGQENKLSFFNSFFVSNLEWEVYSLHLCIS